MQMMNIVILALLALLFVILFVLIAKISKLSSKNKKLNEILEVKNTTIANYEASRVAVKDVIENFSSMDEVMKLINLGKSKASISEQLGSFYLMPMLLLMQVIKHF